MNIRLSDLPDTSPSEPLLSQGSASLSFPRPATATLDPPEHSSASSSSGSKRKRETEHSGIRRPLTRASSTSDFSNTVKSRVVAEYRNKCSHCGASPTDVCHVIGSRDNTFQAAIDDGLLDFQNKRQYQNAIAFCGTCHRNYDDPYEPSFFFLPTEISYFISYEKQDRKRRRRLGRREGSIPARICPTAQRYQDHQIEQGVQGAGSGGLYTRIVLRDFLPEYPGRTAFVPGLSEYGATKSRPGSPMAALHRAVTMLRRLNLSGIPQDIKGGLRELQDLYSEPINLTDESSDDGTDGEDLIPESGNEPGPGNWSYSYDLRGNAEAQQTGLRAGFVGHMSGGGSDNRSASILDLEFVQDKAMVQNESTSLFSRSDVRLPPPSLATQAPSARDVFGWNRHWCWGPGATSHDAVKFYKAVI